MNKNKWLIILIIIFMLVLIILLRKVIMKQNSSIYNDDVIKENLGTYQKITANQAYEMMQDKEVIIVDVRTQQEYDQYHIKNAILIPNETIDDTIVELLPNKEATILVYCRSGRRSKEASKKLIEIGYENVYDFGGINDWPYETVKD